MLPDMLARVAKEYVFERGKPFSNNALGNFVRKDLVEELRKRLIFLPFELTAKGSVGQSSWAAVPWLGIFDPLVTDSATRGFYVVYLINPQTEDIYLSMNQGTTAVDEEFGVTTGREVLRRRASDMALRVREHSRDFDLDPIELGSSARLPSGYEAGHSFGRRYDANSIDANQFISDLERMLHAYEALINRGGITPTDAMKEEAGSSDIQETRKYVLSRRIERAHNVRRKVLSSRGAICEGCGLNPKIDYQYTGKVDNSPLDVHHSKPLNGLAEGETRRYKIPEDFLVLCPTCHRMIHKEDDTSDLSSLKKRIGFSHSRNKKFGYP